METFETEMIDTAYGLFIKATLFIDGVPVASAHARYDAKGTTPGTEIVAIQRARDFLQVMETGEIPDEYK